MEIQDILMFYIKSNKKEKLSKIAFHNENKNQKKNLVIFVCHVCYECMQTYLILVLQHLVKLCQLKMRMKVDERHTAYDKNM